MAIPPEHRDHPAADAPAHVPAHAARAGIGDAPAQQVTRGGPLRAFALLALALMLTACGTLFNGKAARGEPPPPPPRWSSRRPRRPRNCSRPISTWRASLR